MSSGTDPLKNFDGYIPSLGEATSQTPRKDLNSPTSEPAYTHIPNSSQADAFVSNTPLDAARKQQVREANLALRGEEAPKFLKDAPTPGVYSEAAIQFSNTFKDLRIPEKAFLERILKEVTQDVYGTTAPQTRTANLKPMTPNTPNNGINLDSFG